MGPENRFIQRVHKKLSSEVYREKMHNPYRGGTPDVWYSGKGGDCWVEYKWLPRQPKRVPTPALSELQKKWLRGRFLEGRDVMVVVGFPDGAYTFSDPTDWEEGQDGLLTTAVGVAQTIEAVCL